MAILSTFIDKLSGATLAGNTLTTYAHSLPATNPELVALQLRSVGSGTDIPQLYALGGNASLLTVGLAHGSIGAASAQPVLFDAYSIVFWAPIR